MALFGTTAPSVAYDSDYVSSCARLVLDQKILCVFQPIFIGVKRNSRLCCCLCGTLLLCIQCYKILFDNNMLWDSFPRKCAAKPLEHFLTWICLNPMS